MGRKGTAKAPTGQELAVGEEQPESERTRQPYLCCTHRHLPHLGQDERHEVPQVTLPKEAAAAFRVRGCMCRSTPPLPHGFAVPRRAAGP
jgi:hypothetical protein